MKEQDKMEYNICSRSGKDICFYKEKAEQYKNELEFIYDSVLGQMNQYFDTVDIDAEDTRFVDKKDMQLFRYHIKSVYIKNEFRNIVIQNIVGKIVIIILSILILYLLGGIN